MKNFPFLNFLLDFLNGKFSHSNLKTQETEDTLP